MEFNPAIDVIDGTAKYVPGYSNRNSCEQQLVKISNAKVVLTTEQPNNITASGNLQVVTTSINIPGSAITQDIPFNLDAFSW